MSGSYEGNTRTVAIQEFLKTRMLVSCLVCKLCGMKTKQLTLGKERGEDRGNTKKENIHLLGVTPGKCTCLHVHHVVTYKGLIIHTVS